MTTIKSAEEWVKSDPATDEVLSYLDGGNKPWLLLPLIRAVQRNAVGASATIADEATADRNECVAETIAKRIRAITPSEET